MLNMVLAIIFFVFTSLGFSNSLLGAAWPSMQPDFGVPVSYAGVISMIIAGGTIVASLANDRLTRRISHGKLTAICSLITAVSLFGFFISRSFATLCILAVPYGLATGSFDATLNNYIAMHYENRHMNWMHCCWGIGSALGPYLMGFSLKQFNNWNLGYGYAAILQLIVTVVLFLSLPHWKKKRCIINGNQSNDRKTALSFRSIIRIPGVKDAMICCFCYNAIEQTASLWSSSYLNIYKNIPSETSASYASMYFIGITIGRALGGFISLKLNHNQMIRLGQIVLLFGIILIILPLNTFFSLAGLIVVGLGTAPIYPSLIHSTGNHFGFDIAPSIVGIQMACSFTGTCFMPALFGLIADHFSVSLFPVFILLFLVLTVIFHERLIIKTKLKANNYLG